MKNLYTDYEIQFIKTHYATDGAKWISDQLGRSKSAILNKAYALNLRHNIQNNKKCNVSFLRSNSLKSFYWMGFIAADGSFNGNGKSLKVALSIKDQSHLQILSDQLNSTIRIYKTTSGFSNGTDCCELSVYDSNIIPEIMRTFDLKCDKTYNPPNVDEYTKFTDEQVLSFFIGFVDGDGCISKKFNGGNRITIQVEASWSEMLEMFNSLIHRYFKYLKITSVSVSSRNGRKYAYLSIGKEKLLSNLANFIVQNDIPALVRKWSSVKPISRSEVVLKNLSYSTSKPITLDGIVFNSISDAARYFGCSNATVSRRLISCQIL